MRQAVLKYGLEVLIVIMLNVCAVGFAGAYFRSAQIGPYFRPTLSVSASAIADAAPPPTE